VGDPLQDGTHALVGCGGDGCREVPEQFIGGRPGLAPGLAHPEQADEVFKQRVE